MVAGRAPMLPSDGRRELVLKSVAAWRHTPSHKASLSPSLPFSLSQIRILKIRIFPGYAGASARRTTSRRTARTAPGPRPSSTPSSNEKGVLSCQAPQVTRKVATRKMKLSEVSLSRKRASVPFLHLSLSLGRRRPARGFECGTLAELRQQAKGRRLVANSKKESLLEEEPSRRPVAHRPFRELSPFPKKGGIHWKRPGVARRATKREPTLRSSQRYTAGQCVLYIGIPFYEF